MSWLGALHSCAGPTSSWTTKSSIYPFGAENAEPNPELQPAAARQLLESSQEKGTFVPFLQGKPLHPQWGYSAHRRQFCQWWIEQPHIGLPEPPPGIFYPMVKAPCGQLFPSPGSSPFPYPKWAYWLQVLLEGCISAAPVRMYTCCERALWHVHDIFAGDKGLQDSALSYFSEPS